MQHSRATYDDARLIIDAVRIAARAAVARRAQVVLRKLQAEDRGRHRDALPAGVRRERVVPDGADLLGDGRVVRHGRRPEQGAVLPERPRAAGRVGAGSRRAAGHPRAAEGRALLRQPRGRRPRVHRVPGSAARPVRTRRSRPASAADARQPVSSASSRARPITVSGELPSALLFTSRNASRSIAATRRAIDTACARIVPSSATIRLNGRNRAR